MLKLRRAFSIVREAVSLPIASIAMAGGDYEHAVYRLFTAPHPRLKVIANKRWGVALLPLPETFAEYLAGGSKELLRRKRRKAEKSGFTLSQIDPLEHLNGILEINRSLPLRQGNAIDPSYVNEVELKRYFADATPVYGVFNAEGVLRGYAHTPIFGELTVFSRLLAHGDDLESGIMWFMVSGIIKDMIDRRDQHQQPLWAMYDTYFGASESLRFFKERLGFVPYRVNWRWEQAA